MSPLALRRRANRLRHHRWALIATFLVALSLAVHHASVALEHHGHDGMKAGTVVEMCLGVLTAVGTTVAAVAAVLICSRRQCVLQALTGPPAKVPRRAIPPRVRAGPVLLIELCVCRC